jgi:hypothetical protein
MGTCLPRPSVSQFGWSAVSPSRPALSQSAACSASTAEHWTLMAVARGATLDQAEGVRTSASASHNPYRAREAEPGSPSKTSLLTTSESAIMLTFLPWRDLSSTPPPRSSSYILNYGERIAAERSEIGSQNSFLIPTSHKVAEPRVSSGAEFMQSAPLIFA